MGGKRKCFSFTARAITISHGFARARGSGFVVDFPCGRVGRRGRSPLAVCSTHSFLAGLRHALGRSRGKSERR